jgi:hypothetical protein
MCQGPSTVGGGEIGEFLAGGGKGRAEVFQRPLLQGGFDLILATDVLVQR